MAFLRLWLRMSRLVFRGYLCVFALLYNFIKNLMFMLLFGGLLPGVLQF